MRANRPLFQLFADGTNAIHRKRRLRIDCNQFITIWSSAVQSLALDTDQGSDRVDELRRRSEPKADGAWNLSSVARVTTAKHVLHGSA